MRLKSLVALVLLTSFAASSLEAVTGLMRDGAVHHETTAAAATHAAGATGEHGHESVEEGPEQDHGPDHRHGTGSDHCTHTHGSALTASPLQLTWTTFAGPTAQPSLPAPTDHQVRPLLHPPRA